MNGKKSPSVQAVIACGVWGAQGSTVDGLQPLMGDVRKAPWGAGWQQIAQKLQITYMENTDLETSTLHTQVQIVTLEPGLGMSVYRHTQPRKCSPQSLHILSPVVILVTHFILGEIDP